MLLGDDDDDVQLHAKAASTAAQRMRLRQEAMRRFVPGKKIVVRPKGQRLFNQNTAKIIISPTLI